MPRNELPPAGQLLRRLTLGSGPLKRASDRLEFLSRVVLLVTLLAAAPISLAAATATYTQARSQAATEVADRRSVPARLLDDVPAPTGDIADHGEQAQRRGVAVWTDTSGVERTGAVSVPAGAEAGHVVAVWLDGDGNRTTAPMTADDVTGLAVSQGLAVFALLSVIAGGVHLWVVHLLDRSRLRRWAAEWASVEPVWTRMVS